MPPREGRLVLFPSWVLHGVLPVGGGGSGGKKAGKGGKPRVSVAFNTGEQNVDITGAGGGGGGASGGGSARVAAS